MASTSTSGIMASAMVNVCSYDVFISFRGDDIRHSFTDHLYHKLVDAGIRTFRDDDEIDEGDLKPELERAIKASKGSIVVISSNYATSTWCLDELWLILEQRRKCDHFVLPIFYHVDPSDVRKQEKTFNIKVKPSTKLWTDDNVNLWKAALTEVANMKGDVLSGYETDFIAKFVDKIVRKVDMKLVSTAAHLTGMDTRAKGINSWLKNDQSGDHVLAVCGMGGSGKTTLAQYIFNSNKQDFENNSFLLEIGKHYKQPDGLLGLQHQLLRDIFRGKNVTISNVVEGATKIVEALKMKRVLIVLDDIDENRELHELFGTEPFHTQSKIIITTRHRDIKAWFSSLSWSCQVRDIELLNEHESLQLLSCHAFGSRIPMDGFKELAVKLAKYCEGNPLALEVLGSSLYVSDEEPRERNEIIEIWRSTLNSLTSQKGDLHSKVQDILQRSFNTLPFNSLKELFLHIACFFVGEYEDYVVKILEHAKSGIRTLINRCLLTVSPSKKLMMHQLLQEMARSIVHGESNDPEKRSRVWHDDSYRVLQKGDGSGTIEGLALDARKLEGWTTYRSPRKTVSLAKMDKLKLLQLKYVEVTGWYKNFPELRWLCWEGCHLKTIPTKLFMSSLVAIEMKRGNFKEFDPPVVLNSLKILNLKDSRKLNSIRNLWRLPNLEDLILWNCFSLKHVCKTIRDLGRLALLDLTGCRNLLKVSFRKKRVNRLERQIALCIGGEIPQSMLSLPQSIEFLFLSWCGFDDKNDVPVLFSGQPISYMNLGNNSFEFLPNNIDLKTLRVLDLTFCQNLKSLLCLPSTLEELYTYYCASLEKITFQSARFRLRTFVYNGCNKLSEIQGLLKLVSVAELDEADLGQMKWIKAYEDHKVDLVGDRITKRRELRVQMLYEYGIMSTYLPQSIEDQSRTTSEYMSSSPFLSFRVPLCPKKRRIQGLNVTLLYTRLSRNEGEDILVLFAKISNTTKGLTWIYNPVVVCKPKVDEDVTWLSYWPIGNILDTDDEVNVSIIVGNRFMVRGCGASLQYMDGEVEQETNTKEEEVIGGDLSEFEVSRRGWYYLCRRDFFMSTGTTPDWFKTLFGDTIQCTELQGRKNYRQSHHILSSEMAFSRGAPWEYIFRSHRRSRLLKSFLSSN